MASKNVLGTALQACCTEPMTGWYRDGFCNTDVSDTGVHTVCAIMSDEFLTYSKAMGNDLSTSMPEYGFQGLKAGDQWCLCAPRWKQAYEDGLAPKVRLASTHERTLDIIPLAWLEEHALDAMTDCVE
jgi:uncharacterized protein